ncbi:Larval cuticle protein 5 [Lucilia cuprina]|uniref:Larval cuticle protein 5 n=1 Tax=Lucilia cuprina TaxID=7375 RepID=A0A0L0CNT3_LUCCU|nr:Larval cuticle protein 5 [Lucilia cuprina]
MKFFIVFAALFALALAAPAEHQAEIVHQESDVEPEGFRFLTETSDGTHHDAEGKVKDVGSEHEAIVVHGSYSWVDEKTGEKFTVNYVADENGFQPEEFKLKISMPSSPSLCLLPLNTKPKSFIKNLIFLTETSDGTHHDAEGKVKDVGSEHEAIVVHGSYSWVDEKTGEKFTANYVADENGFQPEESDVEPEGFRFLTETSDGTHHDAEGKVKDVGTEHEAIAVHGSYSWVDEKTGEKFTVNYVADENGFQPEESFKFLTETSDGNHHDAEGKLLNVGSDHESLAVHGSFSWVDEKTGEKFTVNYVADENGFQPEGAHLPKPEH